MHTVFLAKIWNIWKARKDGISGRKVSSVRRICSEVKEESFSWVSYRAMIESIKWEQWSSFNIYIIIQGFSETIFWVGGGWGICFIIGNLRWKLSGIFTMHKLIELNS